MEMPAFTRAKLSDVGVIKVIMCVPMEEVLCQAVMGWIPVLKHLLSSARGHLGHVQSCQTLNATAS
jgi:hypothetical protein